MVLISESIKCLHLSCVKGGVAFVITTLYREQERVHATIILNLNKKTMQMELWSLLSLCQSLYIMMTWTWNTFCITGPLWGESTGQLEIWIEYFFLLRWRGWFDIKMLSNQYMYRNSHCGDKTILWPYLPYGISYTGKIFILKQGQVKMISASWQPFCLE